MDVRLDHRIFIPVSHPSCIIQEHADGGHGAANDPSAAHTVMMQVECYGCAEYGIPRLERASQLLLCIASLCLHMSTI